MMVTWSRAAAVEVMRNGRICLYFEERSGRTLINWEYSRRKREKSRLCFCLKDVSFTEMGRTRGGRSVWFCTCLGCL